MFEDLLQKAIEVDQFCSAMVKGDTLGHEFHGNQYGMPDGVEPAESSAQLISDPGYVYHATNRDRAEDISQQGIKTYKPWHGTDQDAWPDGSTEKRNYFSDSVGATYSFAPEEGKSVVLRVPKYSHDFKQERYTNDVYSNKTVPPHKIEILGNDNKWYKMGHANRSRKG